MRVVIHHTHFYDWVPVPDDVTVSEDDVKAGRVREMTSTSYDPNGKPRYQMQVTVEPKEPTHTVIGVKEDDVFAKIVQAYQPAGGNRFLSRRQAVAELIGVNVMPQHGHPKHFTGVEVHDDHDDDDHMAGEAARFREHLEHLSTIPNARTNRSIIDLSDIDELVKLYSEPTKAHHHVAHLHQHFRIKPSPAAPATPEKGAAS